jgi:ion channel-forming bestrophin family protein
MIVSKTPQVYRILQYLGFPLLSLIVWDFLIVYAFEVLHWNWVASRHIPLAMYGSAIGIVVGFRNNSAYSRWWEARTIWGQIVNNSRNLARQVCTPLNADSKISVMQRKIVYYQIAFGHALRQQLRGLDPLEEIRSLISSDEIAEIAGEKNIALAILMRIGTMLKEARKLGWIDNSEWLSIDRTISELTASQGGLERIKNTPLPRQYDFFPILFVQIYCFLLPVGMVEGLRWFTPLGSTLVGFMFLALDRIGRNLENPFDNTLYDLPLTAMTRTIEINLRQTLGETALPEPTAPVHGILW